MNMAAPTPIDTAKGPAFPVAARRLFGNVRLEFPAGLENDCELQSVTVGSCRLSRLVAETHTVFGDRVATGSDTPDSIKLIAQDKGRSILLQGGRRIGVGNSQLVLYDPTQPYTLANLTAVSLLMLQMPRDALGAPLLQRLKEPFIASAGISAILSSMMASTLAGSDGLDAATRHCLGETMTGLVRGLAGQQPADEAEEPQSLHMLMQRIEIYLEAHLCDPDLDVRSIARRMGCSERYVYRAFETCGTTPADYIWSSRIERAADHLRDAADRPGVISRIAFDLGFSSSAHFARTFRNRFGMTPSDYRRTAHRQALS